MEIRTLLNEGPGMFWRYQRGDRLIEGPTVVLSAPAVTEATAGLSAEQADHAICDMVWPIGNRMAPDANGREWPQRTRSLSTGDVIIVGEAAYAIESVGFARITDDFALAVSLSEFGRQNERLAESRLAQR